MDIPGFNKEDVNIEIDNNDYLIKLVLFSGFTVFFRSFACMFFEKL